jgi:hypothetical protein
MKRYQVYLCNAIAEPVLKARAITTDSPAATNKVISMSRALKKAGGTPLVLSFGRGRQRGTGFKYSIKVGRLNGTPIIYAAFWHLPVLTHIVSLCSAAAIVLSLCWRRRVRSLIIYNRSPHAICALMIANLFHHPCVLDLEDGYIPSSSVSVIRWLRLIGRLVKENHVDRIIVAFSPLPKHLQQTVKLNIEVDNPVRGEMENLAVK